MVESLATLAYEGRRRDFAEEQLIAALRILQAGDVDPVHMRGSWAGAMGHTQFIPTSYLIYAVDFTGDGRRDIWSDDPTDALASAANYLARSGWTRGQPWGVEVRLPRRLQLRQRRPVERPPGLRLARPRRDADERPAAARPRLGGDHRPRRRPRPGFAVFHNFFVIKKYNNATSYAMGVGHLGDRIMGGGAVPGRLAARRARALPHREDRAAGAADRPRLRHRLAPTA